MSYEYQDRPLTVGDIRAIIANLPDDMQVLTSSIPAGAYADWFNINSIHIPTGEDGNGFSALTLFLADTYDSRQF